MKAKVEYDLTPEQVEELESIAEEMGRRSEELKGMTVPQVFQMVMFYGSRHDIDRKINLVKWAGMHMIDAEEFKKRLQESAGWQYAV